MDHAEFDRIVRNIYCGITDPDGWLPVLDDLRVLTNSEHADLLVFDRVKGGISVSEISQFDADLLHEYESHYCYLDPVRPIVDALKVGQWCFDLRDIGMPTMARMEFYQTFLRSHGLASIMALPIVNDDKALATISFQSGLRRGAYHEHDAAILQPLVPHLLQAAALRSQFHELTTKARLGQAVLDQVHKAVLVVDAKARVHFANLAGRRWLSRQKDGFCRQASVHLSSTWARVEQLARQICGEVPQNVTGLRIQEDDGRRASYLIGLPLAPDHPIALGYNMPMGLLIVHDDTDPPAPMYALLRQLFGITQAEARLIEMLWIHETLHAAASSLQVARETARTQLRSIFLKTGCTSQQALLRLVTELSQMH